MSLGGVGETLYVRVWGSVKQWQDMAACMEAQQREHGGAMPCSGASGSLLAAMVMVDDEHSW
jgi:hypothetical protein